MNPRASVSLSASLAFSCSLENFIQTFVNFKFFSRLFFVQTFFSSDFFKIFQRALLFRCWVPKGCLRGARFARNFFEKSFNSYLELEPLQHSVTRRGTFWRGARAERRDGSLAESCWVCLPGRFAPKNFARIFPKIRKNSRKCSKSYLQRVSQGGPHLFWGLHDVLF